MTPIYLLLTGTATIPARMIRRVTGDTYSHVSIAVDGRWRTFYSFARRYLHFPLPAGLVKESLFSGYYIKHPDTPCMLLALMVEDDVYLRAKEMLEEMYRMQTRYRYNVIGLFLCWFGVAYDRPEAYFCSHFVAAVLEESGAAVLPKPASLMHPVDLSALPGVHCMYCGTLAGLRRRMLRKNEMIQMVFGGAIRG